MFHCFEFSPHNPWCTNTIAPSTAPSDNFIRPYGYFVWLGAPPIPPRDLYLDLPKHDSIADGVEGALNGSSNRRVTRMIYAGDVCLTANRPDQKQSMLNRSDVYAKRKGLTINIAK